MPIEFHDAQAVELLGFAAFLHIETQGDVAYGALLFINARGEPQEFVFNHLELLNEVLWRGADREAGAGRRLCASLFASTTLSPRFLLFNEQTVAPTLLSEESGISLAIPAGAVAAVEPSDEAHFETFNGEGELIETRVDWIGAAPDGELFGLLCERGLVWEPFARAAAGLREAFSELE